MTHFYMTVAKRWREQFIIRCQDIYFTYLSVGSVIFLLLLYFTIRQIE